MLALVRWRTRPPTPSTCRPASLTQPRRRPHRDVRRADVQPRYGTAANIKSRVNRLSVLGAITSTQQRLKLYNRVPTNGLVIYCGTIVTDEGKERRVNIDFEPFKPVNTSLYLCDNKFHTEVGGA